MLGKSFLFLSVLLSVTTSYHDYKRDPKEVSQEIRQNLKSCEQFQCKRSQPYTLALLTLSWPGQFCHKKNVCHSGWLDHWNGYSFRVRGYWPTYDQEDQTCVKNGRCPDPTCKSDYLFVDSIDKTYIEDLKSQFQKYWPQYGKEKQGSFLQNEWNTHGVCFLKIMNDLFPGRYTNDQVFRYYFESTVQKSKIYSRVSKFQYNSKQELAQMIGLQDPDTFFIKCSRSSQNIQSHKCFVDSIRICYNLTEPGMERPTKCFSRDLNSHKPISQSYPIVLQNTKKLSQIILDDTL